MGCESPYLCGITNRGSDRACGQNSDDGFVRSSWLPWKTSEHLATPSNVTRICRALQPRSDDGVSQIVFYQAGVGSDNNWYSFFLGGYLGDGLVEHVREAYAFLCNVCGQPFVLFGYALIEGAELRRR